MLASDVQLTQNTLESAVLRKKLNNFRPFHRELRHFNRYVPVIPVGPWQSPDLAALLQALVDARDRLAAEGGDVQLRTCSMVAARQSAELT